MSATSHRSDPVELAAGALHAEVMARMPEHIERLTWSGERLAQHQRAALRHVVTTARDRSDFHAGRLADIDAERLELEDLASLPTMTKHDLMSRFDDVSTRSQVTRDAAETAVAATGSLPRSFADGHVVLASGGSSGERGLFVYERDALVQLACSLVRPALARLQALGITEPVSMAMVAAGSGVHATRAIAALAGGGPVQVTTVPATLPLAEVVERLNALQPLALQCYSSLLPVLCAEQHAGRLHIAPLAVTGTSEPFGAEARALVEQTFGVGAVDQLGTSEGLVGSSPPGTSAIALASDLAIVELVDEHHRPVPPGTPSTKVLLTRLFGTTQPLIRYELTDRFVLQPPAADHGHLCVTVEGRTDDVLQWGDVRVHPLVLRSVLVRHPEVIEYQVVQQDAGVLVRTVGAPPSAELGDHLSAALRDAGLVGAAVVVEPVPALDRHPETGKVTRFVALGSRR